MRGILLAGGSGSRLWPVTKSVSKQLLPVYDKPMIYYPLSTLVTLGINEILVITTREDLDVFKRLLGDGSQWGLELTYRSQSQPNGIGHAFTIGADFVGTDPVALILGDSIFHGDDLGPELAQHGSRAGARIFAYRVTRPEDYGVIEIGANGRVVSIEEKPRVPKSNYAVPGLYFYDSRVTAIARAMRPSTRGELEITDINNAYLRSGDLSVTVLDRGTAWLDAGTFDSLAQATEFVRVTEQCRGIKIGCIEEAAWRAGFIDSGQLMTLADGMRQDGYGRYLASICAEADGLDHRLLPIT